LPNVQHKKITHDTLECCWRRCHIKTRIC